MYSLKFFGVKSMKNIERPLTVKGFWWQAVGGSTLCYNIASKVSG
jgi:hypothetical protein